MKGFPYHACDGMLEEVKELKISIKVVAIEQRHTFISDQCRHIINRRYFGPRLLLESIENLVMNIKWIFSS